MELVFMKSVWSESQIQAKEEICRSVVSWQIILITYKQKATMGRGVYFDWHKKHTYITWHGTVLYVLNYRSKLSSGILKEWISARQSTNTN